MMLYKVSPNEIASWTPYQQYVALGVDSELERFKQFETLSDFMEWSATRDA